MFVAELESWHLPDEAAWMKGRSSATGLRDLNLRYKKGKALRRCFLLASLLQGVRRMCANGRFTIAPAPMALDEEVEWLCNQSSGWITRMHDIHLPHARQLSDEQRQPFVGYFETLLLDSARVRNVDSIENPEFYRTLDPTIASQPIDFREMDGITFDNVILLKKKRMSQVSMRSLLFHELVHVVQYRALGVKAFTRRYIHGWIEGGMQYGAIPLEVDAYALQDAFVASASVFSVEGTLRQRLSHRRET